MKPQIITGDLVKFTFNNVWKDSCFLVTNIYESNLGLKTCTTVDLKTLKERVFYYDDLSVI